MTIYKNIFPNDGLDQNLLDSLDSVPAVYKHLVEDAAIFFDPRTGRFTRYEDFRERLYSIEDFVGKVLKSKDPGFCWSKSKNSFTSLERYDGSEFIKKLYRFFQCLPRFGPEKLQYSETVQMYFDIVSEMNLSYFIFTEIDHIYNDPRNRISGGHSFFHIHEIQCGDLFNEFIKRIREVAASAKFKKKVRDRANNSKLNKLNLKCYIGDIFKTKSKALLLRIDFEYDKEIAKSVTIKQAKMDRDRYLNNMRNNELFKTVVGYIWKLEDGEERGLHYHFIFFLDGSLSLKDSFLAEEFGKYWVETVTKGRGIYFNCNRHPMKYKNFCIGMIEHTDEIKRKNLMIVIEYLTKPDQYLRIKGSRMIGRGETPKRTTSKAGNHLGRPRKYESCHI
jgi:hypothetical protein